MSKQHWKFPGGDPVLDLTRDIYNVESTPLLTHWLRTYEHNRVHRGSKEGVKYMRQLYTQAIQFALYQPITCIPFRKSDRDGICKDLKPFKTFLRASVPEARSALAVLRQFELIQIEPDNDLSTVTDPCPKQPRFLQRKFEGFCKRHLRKYLPLIEMKKPMDHLTTKKGPSKQGALLSWRSDLWNLHPDMLETIVTLAEQLSDDKFRSRVNRLLNEIGPQSPAPTSRLQVFPAPGGKTRIIAIYDYWSQRVLKSLHKAIFNNLPKIESDCTYGHESAAEWLKTLPKGTEVFSFDLTAATDRIPMWIHRCVLRETLVHEQRVLIPLIEKILLREFSLSWDMTKRVTYNCGQPMGAYGSWALLAYSHHAIARYCGCTSADYRIIGDDIVIKGMSGKRYREFMKMISVSISENKSIVSRRSFKSVVGEVAKRLIRDGQEISPPTANLLRKAKADWRIGPVLLEDLVRRGWYPLEQHPVAAFLNHFYSKKWARNVVSVLTFPYGRGSKALSLLRGVLEPISPWKEYCQRELAINFVRYRLALLNRTASRLIKGNEPYDILAGGGPQIRIRDYAEIEDSPEKTIRAFMAQSMIETFELLQGKLKDLNNPEVQPEEVQLEILDEELFCPDISLNFIEKKYQRQNFFSNTLLDLKRRFDNGTLESFVLKYERPPFMTIVSHTDDELSEAEEDWEVVDFDF